MGPVTDVPLLERGSPETNRGPAVANPRIRVCSTVVSAAAPCHARSSGGHLASERIGDEHPCLQLLNRDMRVDHEGSPPCAAPGHARSWSVMGGWCRPPRCWSRWVTGSGRGRGPDLASYRPGKGRHLAGDRGGDQVRVLARRDQAAVAGAQPELRLPGDRPYLVRHAL